MIAYSDSDSDVQVSNAPAGTTAATADVAKAYRCVGISFVHKQYLCLYNLGCFFVDHCLLFGLELASGLPW